MNLRSEVIRLAHQNESLRPALLQMLTARWAPADMGTTNESDKLRWHVYNSAVRVWDLTFAGKRGKRVSRFALYDIDMVGDETFQKAADIWIRGLKKNNYAQALKAAQDLVSLSQEAEGWGTAKLEVGEDKGVDVAPPGFKPFKANWKNVTVEATYDSFVIRDKGDRNNLPTCIPTSKGGKQSIKVFYRWVQDNERKIKSMTYYQILNSMGEAGIRYHDYCAMD